MFLVVFTNRYQERKAFARSVAVYKAPEKVLITQATKPHLE